MADGGRSGATTLTHLWAADLLTIPTLTCKTLHVLVFIAHGPAGKPGRLESVCGTGGPQQRPKSCGVRRWHKHEGG